MPGKKDRQGFIRRAIRSGKVATQRELARALRKERMSVGQSTLSRDLAELDIRKVNGRYVSPDRAARPPAGVNYAEFVSRFVTCGPHQIVIATAPGRAQPVAVAIDEARDASIVATLAGDDTIFVATRTRRTQAVALRRLERWFGDKHER